MSKVILWEQKELQHTVLELVTGKKIESIVAFSIDSTSRNIFVLYFILLMSLF